MTRMSEQSDRSAADLDPADRAEQLEGLDPEQPDAEKTTEKVQGVAKDGGAESEVGSMSREDP
jgi:hypothetical protein